MMFKERIQTYSLNPLFSSPKVTSCKSVAEYHNEDIDIDTVKIRNIFITTKIPNVALL